MSYTDPHFFFSLNQLSSGQTYLFVKDNFHYDKSSYKTIFKQLSWAIQFLSLSKTDSDESQ